MQCVFSISYWAIAFAIANSMSLGEGSPVSRHTHAADLRAECVDIGIISKQRWHRSIASTARYLDHVTPWDVVERLESDAD